MKEFFRIITLQSAAVSTHRKQQFMLSVIVLALLVAFKVFSAKLQLDIPYATQISSIVLYALLTNMVVNIFRILVVSNHRKRRNIPNEDHDNFTVGLNAIVNVVTIVAVIVSIFAVFQIEFRSFLSSIALVAVALTIIFQDFIKNFLFGFSIMFSADYEIGDYVQIGTLQKGVIRNITFSNIQLKTEEGDILFVPNSVVYSQQITNFSRLRPKRVHIEFALLRSQVTSIDHFEKEIFSFLEKKYPETFDIAKCRIFVKETNKDEIICGLEAPTKKANLKLREQINHTVQKFAVEYTVNKATKEL